MLFKNMLNKVKSALGGANQKITFKVDDMHCESCPKVIAMDLEDAAGVASVNASLETKKVDVEYDPSQTNPQKLQEVIKTSGYTSTIQ